MKVWDYVNSDNSKESLLSTESSESTVSQIKADAMTVIDLKEDQLSQYSYLCKIWKRKNAAFEKTKQDLTDFCTYFYFTVNVNIIVYLIKNKDSLYKIMKVLRNEYCILIKTY